VGCREVLGMQGWNLLKAGVATSFPPPIEGLVHEERGMEERRYREVSRSVHSCSELSALEKKRDFRHIKI